MASDSKPLTAKEVSEILRVHPVTLYRLLGEGRIPSFKIGGQWRFRMDLLES
jgi:excisionase family DNA binding protein